MMVLISSPKDLNLIALNGDISTAHLDRIFAGVISASHAFPVTALCRPGPHRVRAIPTWRRRLIPACRIKPQSQPRTNTPAV